MARKKATAVQPTNQISVNLSGHAKPKQLPFIVRAIWFLAIGWVLALIWISIAIVFALLIVTLPIASWMFERTNAVMTLQQ